MENKSTDAGSFESLKRILEQHQANMPQERDSTALTVGDVFARLKHFGPDEGDAELLMPPRGCDGLEMGHLGHFSNAVCEHYREAGTAHVAKLGTGRFSSLSRR